MNLCLYLIIINFVLQLPNLPHKSNLPQIVPYKNVNVTKCPLLDQEYYKKKGKTLNNFSKHLIQWQSY